MKNYEITLYNQDVRELVQGNEIHPNFDDGWADQRFLQIKASTVEDARKAIHRRYPERLGFVIVDVLEMPEFG